MGKPHMITVRVPITVQVDAATWAHVNGLLDPDNPRGYHVRAVRADIISAITHQITNMEMIEETGASVNGATVHDTRPDRATNPPTMIRMPDEPRNFYQSGKAVDIHQRWTDHLASLPPTHELPEHSRPELHTVATTTGDVYRMISIINDDVIVYSQRQGTCVCGNPATEVIDLEAIDDWGMKALVGLTSDLIPKRCTIMLCAACNLAQWEED